MGLPGQNREIVRQTADPGRYLPKNSDLRRQLAVPKIARRGDRVTFITALAIASGNDEFGLEFVLWLTDQNGPDA